MVFDSLSNFRDLGGVTTLDRHTFRTGLIFRSDAPTHLTLHDLALFRELKIRLICDLRSPQEHRQPSYVHPRVVNVPIHTQPTLEARPLELLRCLFFKNGADRFHAFTHSFYQHLAFADPTRIGQVIHLLAQDGNLPALIHCNAGMDRTGLMAAILQLSAGVSYETVRAEYLRTDDAFAPRRARFIRIARLVSLFQISRERLELILTAHPEDLDEVYRRMLAEYGSVETYLISAAKVDADTLRKLKLRLVE